MCCVFAVFFVFVASASAFLLLSPRILLVPLAILEHRATPRGYPQHIGISSFWLPRISPRNSFPPKNLKKFIKSPTLVSGPISRLCEFHLVLVHGSRCLGADLHFHKFSSLNLVNFSRNQQIKIWCSWCSSRTQVS